jgi:hypothetical protein
MKIGRYRKRPVEVDAVLFENPLEDAWAIAEWCGGEVCYSEPRGYWIEIPTLEGTMEASVGDRVVRGTRGEFYPVKPEPFVDTFVEVEALDRGMDYAHGEIDE